MTNTLLDYYMILQVSGGTMTWKNEQTKTLLEDTSQDNDLPHVSGPDIAPVLSTRPESVVLT